MSRRTTTDTTPRTPFVRPAVAPFGHGRTPLLDPGRPISGPPSGVEVRTVEASLVDPVERLECHLVAVPVAGTTTHEVDFETHRLRPGQVLHVRPGQVHRCLPGRSGAYRELRIRPDLVPDRLFPAGWYDPVPSGNGATTPSVPTAAAVVELISADLEAHGSAGQESSEVMTAGTRYLLLRLARIGRPTPGIGTVSGDLVAALLAEIERSFSRSRAVGDYARSLGTSARTLSRATAALLDLPPKELIDGRVVLEAKRLLVVTTMPVTEVAEVLGFSEATNFSKFFLRRCGAGPLEFRIDH